MEGKNLQGKGELARESESLQRKGELVKGMEVSILERKKAGESRLYSFSIDRIFTSEMGRSFESVSVA